MTWKTPKVVEVPVGMEINMYACAAQVDSIKAICPAPTAVCCSEPGRRALRLTRWR